MNYIVMDLEFNQPFDFAHKKIAKANKEIPFEIVQIGCVKLDDKFNQIGSFNMLVKPTVYKRIHPYVQKITSLNSASFKDAKSFTEVFSLFLSFIGDAESIFCVWGDIDLKLLYKNASFYKIPSDKIPKKYINVQVLAGKKLQAEEGRLIGLKNAIEMFDIKIDEPFHDAFNDALYTSYILKKLDVKPENIKIFSDKKQVKVRTKKFTTDLTSLYGYVEKEYGRKLTRKEKDVFRNVYLSGINKKFETANENDKNW